MSWGRPRQTLPDHGGHESSESGIHGLKKRHVAETGVNKTLNGKWYRVVLVGGPQTLQEKYKKKHPTSHPRSRAPPGILSIFSLMLFSFFHPPNKLGEGEHSSEGSRVNFL